MEQIHRNVRIDEVDFFTRQEFKILQLDSEGQSNQEICEKLFIGESTVHHV